MIPLTPATESGAEPRDVQWYLRPGSLSLPALPPLSLYIHLPWCLKKCPYCDFNSHERTGVQGLVPALEGRYLEALRQDLIASLPLIWGRPIHSIFIGGGTPSLFSPDALATLIADCRAMLPLEPQCEITMEANPGTFEKDRFRAFAQAGVTRLSIGVQSFDDTKLKALGRVHDGAQARAAVEEAARSFQTFNLDLMYALPGQSMQEWQADLATAMAFEPPHLSLYHLTLEPNTLFAVRPPELPDDDSAFDMLDHLVEATAAQGYERYEVSAYAKPGHRCAHNLNYWQFGDYLGIGAGAHGKLSYPHRVIRQVRWREPERYMSEALAGRAMSQCDEVARDALPFEFMLNALRLRGGFETQMFSERTGLPVSTLRKGLDEAERLGLLEPLGIAAQAWRPTAKGFDFLSDLQGLFLQG